MSLLFIFMFALYLSGTLSPPLVGNPLIPEILAPLCFFIPFSYAFNDTVPTAAIICNRIRGAATGLLK
jgi:hypothetical protein